MRYDQPVPGFEGEHETLGRSVTVQTRAMGGQLTVQIAYGEGRGDAASAAASAAIDEVRRIEALVNMWSAHSALQRWNAAVLAGAESAPMPRELALLVELAGRVHTLTGGAYDPTVARALAELGFYGDALVLEAGAPDDSAPAKPALGMQAVEVLWGGPEATGDRSPFREHDGLPPEVIVWRELLAAAPLPNASAEAGGEAAEAGGEAAKVADGAAKVAEDAGSSGDLVGGAGASPPGAREGASLADADLIEVRANGRLLDLSALAKGYAAERALHVVQAAGFANAFVDLGGSSIAASGKRFPGDTGWPVELPDGAGSREVRLRDRALSTSGQTSLTIEAAEGAPSHLFDPRSGAPVAHATEQVTVVTRAAWLGDALATALLVMGAEDGAAWCGAHPELVLGSAFYVVGAPVAFGGEL